MNIDEIKKLYNSVGLHALRENEIVKLINAIIAERDNALTQNAELVAQVAQLQSFIESVMANIGAGATMAEVADMLCDWYDSKEKATQCLRDIQAEAVKSVSLDAYDAGYLNDFGGGNVGWWQDYMRSELGAAHDFYQSQIDQYAHSIRQEK